jgi:DNA-binding CsgD family transcriptional regulator
MINKRTVFEMYRLKDFGFSRREIARQLNIDRATVAKYLDNPDPAPG